MPRNRPVGAFGIVGEGDGADFENDYSACRCNFCGKKYDALGGVEIYIQVLLDARWIDKFAPRGTRKGTGGYICFRCFNAGPQRLADRHEKRAARLKDKDCDIFTASIFRKFPDFTAFKGYKLAKVIADAQ
jgi:hypothetical protein